MDLELQALLDELAKEGGDLAALLANKDITAEKLQELESEALDAFDGIRKSDNPTDDDVAALEALADVVKGIRAERGNRDAAAAELAARMEALAAELNPEPTNEATTGSDDDVDEDDDEVEAPAAETTEPAAEPAPVEVVEPAAVIEADTDAPELVTAAGTAKPTRRKVTLRDFASRVQPPKPVADAETSLGQYVTAAADVPGISAAAPIGSYHKFAELAINRIKAMPQGRRAVDKPLQYGLATIAKPHRDGLIVGKANAQEAIDFAGNESRLPGGSLVAAGGWCGPAERWTDLCDLNIDLSGLFDIPSVTVNRGRVEYMQGPDYCSLLPIIEQGFFHMTSAQVDAGEEKPCVEVPCPDDLLECELEVYGLCITAGILTRHSYPEWVEQFIRFALAAHEMRMSQAKLDKVVEGSTDLGVVPGAPSATASVLNAIEYIVEWLRYRNRTRETFELVAPSWIRSVIRNDLAKRDGLEYLSVSDQQIHSWFSQRGVRVQWLQQWQKLADCPEESGSISPGASPGALDTPPMAWPEQVEFLIYPAGTWVAAEADIINVSTIYDSCLLRTNRYHALFTEEALCVINRCPGSWKFQVDICPNGATSAPVPVECPVL